VADTGNNCIRLITPSGAVSTFAGSRSAAWTDGTGTLASFFNPHHLALAANGNLLVADAGNHRLRMVTPLGVVSTVAGGASAAFQDGLGTSLFSSPRGIAVGAFVRESEQKDCGGTCVGQMSWRCSGCQLTADAALTLTLDFRCQALLLELGAAPGYPSGALKLARADPAATAPQRGSGQRLASLKWTVDVTLLVQNDTSTFPPGLGSSAYGYSLGGGALEATYAAPVEYSPSSELRAA
jgi:hypothetical protein